MITDASGKATRIVLAVVAAGTLFLAGCGTGPSNPEQPPAGSPGGAVSPPAATSPPAAPTPHDPPLKFDKQPRDALLRAAFRLRGRVAYQFDTGGALHFDGSLNAIDLLTGQPLWSVKPGARARTLSDKVRPLLVSIGGRDLVIGAVPVSVQGSGTTADRAEIHVIAVDAANGQTAWTTVIPGSDVDAGTEDGFVEVAFANEQAIVVNLLNSVVVLDPATHQQRWQRDGFVAGGLQGDVVSGLTGKKYAGQPPSGTRVPTGLAVLDGAPRWHGAGLDGVFEHDAGPGLTQFAGTTSEQRHVSTLVDPATGVVRASLEGTYTCAYDGRSVTVCTEDHLANPGTIAGFDTPSAQLLWKYPGGDKNRLPVEVAVAFHGAVYGSTQRGGVVLDARTGNDLGTTDAIVPLAVSEFLAVVKGNTIGKSEVHLAVG